MRSKSPPLVAAFDLQSVLLVTFLALVLLMVIPQRQAQIETLGLYAITARWEKGSLSDIDLYVRDPRGNIVYFGHRDAGGMHLEHDDLGAPDETNFERIVIRSEEDGEYVVNVHAYIREPSRHDRVVVELWRLRGEDRRLHSQTVVLAREGQEETAFRFTARGRYSRLPARFIGGALG